MAWIKRHLFFVVGGLLALIFLGGAGFYIFQNWSRNGDNSQQLADLYAKLQQAGQSPLQPGATNTQVAKDQQAQLQDWITGATKYFARIPPIPAGSPVSTADYAEALRQTIDSLQHEADSASVALPPQYDFSFAAQRSRVKFSGVLDPLAAQLGEVKAISEVLFAARVNNLDGIQRVRVSDDDLQGVPSDYVDLPTVTNSLAIVTPYLVTFRCFTPELARVLAGFATSQYPFIVKSVSAQPAVLAAPADAAGGPGGMPPGMLPGMLPGEQPQPAAMTPAPGKGGLQTVLKEQMLRITLEVDLVKLLPKS